MHRRAIIKTLFATGFLFLLIPAYAAPGSPREIYPNGTQTALKLGGDLYGTLNEKLQRNVNPQLIRIEASDSPFITPIESSEGNRTSRLVSVSVGYIELLNHIAHAKAIDQIQPGYFREYVQGLAKQNGAGAPPDTSDSRFWKEDVMNDQMSYFNQMMGMTVALSLSHHYLGHYNKYANLMLASKLTPINSFITPDEWETSVKTATLNSLDCAVGVGGATALFDAMDMMTTRPAWTAFIIPAGIDVKTLDKTLVGYENDYFHGGLKLPASASPMVVASGSNKVN